MVRQGIPINNLFGRLGFLLKVQRIQSTSQSSIKEQQMSDSDPYIGKIIQLNFRNFIYDKQYEFYTLSASRYCLYEYNSLFLIVGIKEKKCEGHINQYYILKPLQNDNHNANSNKQLVWHNMLMAKYSIAASGHTIID